MLFTMAISHTRSIPPAKPPAWDVRNLATRSCSVHRRIHRRGNENDRQDNDRGRKHNVPDRAALLAEVEVVGANSAEEKASSAAVTLDLGATPVPYPGWP